MSAQVRKSFIYLMSIITILSIISAVYVSIQYQGQVTSLETKVRNLEKELAKYKSLTILDDMGYVTMLINYSKRVVSMAPSNTEILFALRLGDKVVGVTKFCDYPPEVPDRVKDGKITVIGGFADPSVERIIALQPDLVIGTGIHTKVASILRDKGLNVILLEPKNINEILQRIIWVGRITGEDKEAADLVSGLRLRIDVVLKEVANATYKPKVYYEVWHDPLMSVGPETWVNDLIGLAGGINIFVNATVKYPKVSSESVIEQNPDIIIIPKGHGAKAEQMKTRPGWETISAVKNGRIYEIDSNIVARPGPRIVDGLEALAEIIHPELFPRGS